MDSGFRQLDARERGLLEKLLEAEFPGRDELRAQLASLTAKQIEEDGTLSLRCDSGPPSRSKSPIEGTCKDADGKAIDILLHRNKRGFMYMLEIIKPDGSPIINPPCARDLVLLPEGGGRKPEDVEKRALTEEERVVLAVRALDREVNNGGYHKFFCDSSRKFVPIIVDSLLRIGCDEAAKITQRALDALRLPAVTPDDVRATLERRDDVRDLELDQCDLLFYKTAQHIADRLDAFIKENKIRI